MKKTGLVWGWVLYQIKLHPGIFDNELAENCQVSERIIRKMKKEIIKHAAGNENITKILRIHEKALEARRSKRKNRLNILVKIVEKTPEIEISILAKKFGLGEDTIALDLRDLLYRSDDPKTRKIMNLRKMAIQRIRRKVYDKEKKARGEVTAYDLLDHIENSKNWGKTMCELADDLGVKKHKIITFFIMLVRDAEDPTNPKKVRDNMKTILINYANGLRNKPKWFKRWVKAMTAEMFVGIRERAVRAAV